MNKDMIQVTNHDFLIYKDNSGNVKVNVMLINHDLWLTQDLIAELFGTARSTITEHISNIFKSGELNENNTVGKTDVINSKKPVKIYNLDMIIAVGYRVNSKKATNFRIWATKTLKEYIIKGAVLDVERLKNPSYIFGEDYFEETLEKIKDIRSSERRFYQKITDIYCLCSVDYDRDSEITKEFFQTVQNKLHFAITGNTAAEIIYKRVDAGKEHMGLTSWKASPAGPIRKYDVNIAKNYLNEKELKSLNRIVTMYLDYAELQAENHNAMTMKDWIEKLNAFLQFNGQDILNNAGKISQKVAQELAYKEYEKFKVKQNKLYRSDFDILVEGIEEYKIEKSDKH
ncbi:MAG: virulence RhuM family protein [bacterium]|nr:virulence RhuM family protein [bacterium]